MNERLLDEFVLPVLTGFSIVTHIDILGWILASFSLLDRHVLTILASCLARLRMARVSCAELVHDLASFLVCCLSKLLRLLGRGPCLLGHGYMGSQSSEAGRVRVHAIECVANDVLLDGKVGEVVLERA